MKKILFISTAVLGLTALTSLTTGLKSFCNYFENEQLDSCATILNNYFKSKEQTPVQSLNLELRFKELDTLMNDLEKLNCVDTCFYRGDGRGAVMKTKIPMTDIFIYKKLSASDTSKYLLRVAFDKRTKVVWLRKWEY